MRKQKLFSVLIALVLACACTLGLLIFSVGAERTSVTTYTVGSGMDYATVEAALEAASQVNWSGDQRLEINVTGTQTVTVTDEILFGGVDTIFDANGERLPITVTGGTLQFASGATGNVVCSNSYTFKDINFYIGDVAVTFYAGSGEVVLEDVVLSASSQAKASFYADCPTAAAFEGWADPGSQKVATSLTFKETDYAFAVTSYKVGAVGSDGYTSGANVLPEDTEVTLVIEDSQIGQVRVRGEALSAVSKVTFTSIDNSDDNSLTTIKKLDGVGDPEDSASVTYPAFDLEYNFNGGTYPTVSYLIQYGLGVNEYTINFNEGVFSSEVAPGRNGSTVNGDAIMNVRGGTFTSTLFGPHNAKTGEGKTNHTIISGGTIKTYRGTRMGGAAITTVTGGTITTYYGTYGSTSSSGDYGATNNISGGTITTFYGGGISVTSSKVGSGFDLTNIENNISGGEIDTYYGAGIASDCASLVNNVSGGTIGTFYGFCDYSGTNETTDKAFLEDSYMPDAVENNVSGGVIGTFYGAGVTSTTVITNNVTGGTITDFFGVASYVDVPADKSWKPGAIYNTVNGAAITNFRGTGNLPSYSTNNSGLVFPRVDNKITGSTIGTYFGTGDIVKTNGSKVSKNCGFTRIFNAIEDTRISGDYYGTGIAEVTDNNANRAYRIGNYIGGNSYIGGDFYGTYIRAVGDIDEQFSTFEAFQNLPDKDVYGIGAGEGLLKPKILNIVVGGEFVGAYYGQCLAVSGGAANIIRGGTFNTSTDYEDADKGYFACYGEPSTTVYSFIDGGTFCKDVSLNHGARYTQGVITGGEFGTYDGETYTNTPDGLTDYQKTIHTGFYGVTKFNNSTNGKSVTIDVTGGTFTDVYVLGASMSSASNPAELTMTAGRINGTLYASSAVATKGSVTINVTGPNAVERDDLKTNKADLFYVYSLGGHAFPTADNKFSKVTFDGSLTYNLKYVNFSSYSYFTAAGSVTGNLTVNADHCLFARVDDVRGSNDHYNGAVSGDILIYLKDCHLNDTYQWINRGSCAKKSHTMIFESCIFPDGKTVRPMNDCSGNKASSTVYLCGDNKMLGSFYFNRQGDGIGYIGVKPDGNGGLTPVPTTLSGDGTVNARSEKTTNKDFNVYVYDASVDGVKILLGVIETDEIYLMGDLSLKNGAQVVATALGSGVTSINVNPGDRWINGHAYVELKTAGEIDKVIASDSDEYLGSWYVSGNQLLGLSISDGATLASLVLNERILVKLWFLKSDVDNFLNLTGKPFTYSMVSSLNPSEVLAAGSISAIHAADATDASGAEYYVVELLGLGADRFAEDMIFSGKAFRFECSILDFAAIGIDTYKGTKSENLFKSIYDYGAAASGAVDTKYDYLPINTNMAAPTVTAVSNGNVTFKQYDILMGDAVGIRLVGTAGANFNASALSVQMNGETLEKGVQYSLTVSGDQVYVDIYFKAQNMSTDFSLDILAGSEEILSFDSSVEKAVAFYVRKVPTSQKAAALLVYIQQVKAYIGL